MNPAKLKKMEGQVRIGGKGSARRKRKHVQRTSTYDEKRLKTTLQKLSLTTVANVNSVTLTMDNGKKMMMSSPKVQGSVMANMFVFSGDMFDVTVPEKKQENEDEDDEVPPLLVSGFDAIAEEQYTRKSIDLTGKDLIIIEKSEQKQREVKKEKDDKEKPSSLMENQEEKMEVEEEKVKSSEQQLAKNKKKKKPKKPRNRVRSRNKIMSDANSNLHTNLDGASHDQIMMQLKDLCNELANLDDSTDANSSADSDKTSIYSDDSFMTLCPDDFNFVSEDDADYIEEEMSILTLCPNNEKVDHEQIGNNDNNITFNVEEPVKSSPDEDDIVINELNKDPSYSKVMMNPKD